MNRQNGLDNITIHSYNRNILAREMISNVLMHREFTSPYMAKFVIEKERMYVENANRATGDGFITPDNLEPNPKNPIIASFFRNIGLADTLGSGTRKLFKYSKYYSGQNPEFKEGDVFRIIVPLNDEYSFDFEQTGLIIKSNQSNQSDQLDQSVQTNQTGLAKYSNYEIKLLAMVRDNPELTNRSYAEKLGWSVSQVKYYIQKLKKKGAIIRVGSNKKGKWELLNEQ
ncbi:MAG: winged helix-turn-helix transcriptional regulator [Clostridiales bacterium]|nr:winged helix-turn-helix transcriptional regulator [Clostridiales bacterium]